MDMKIGIALIGLAAGAFGYWFTTFLMQPILRYRDLHYRVHADFIFYAQVIEASAAILMVLISVILSMVNVAKFGETLTIHPAVAAGIRSYRR